eukprot:m.260753 g.260753  ORF g.260753 m.260753 type:complete len:352 (+) comp40553_c0_seq1:113-1168(+)
MIMVRTGRLCVALVVVACMSVGAIATSQSDRGSWDYSCTAGDNVTKFNYDLKDQTWFITGSDGRLGKPVLYAALHGGASVIALSRNDSMAATNCRDIRGDFPSANVECFGMDLSSFKSVKATVALIASKYASIDVILHIAATIGLNTITPDGFVETVEINAVSPVVINNLLLHKLKAAPKPRIIHVGSADAFQNLGWPATNQVEAGIKWITGKEPHPIPGSTYYFYGFTKFVLLQYSAELALREPTITTFSVNPGYFRDDPSKYKDTCKPQLLFTPCPQYPIQGATSTFFAAGQPAIEGFSGSLIDFKTEFATPDEWVQSGDTCIPRPLPPPWNETQRAQWYDQLQQLIGG